MTGIDNVDQLVVDTLRTIAEDGGTHLRTYDWAALVDLPAPMIVTEARIHDANALTWDVLNDWWRRRVRDNVRHAVTSLAADGTPVSLGAVIQWLTDASDELAVPDH